MHSIITIIIFINLCSFSYPRADMIKPDQTLSGDQTIVSAGGIFKLGYFTPGKSSNHYIGIWYNRVSIETIVWVANRETPVPDRFKYVLKLSHGNLVLVNIDQVSPQVPVWSTNLNSTAATANATVAVLGDDGNLVLRDGYNSNVSSLWESFEYPTHTWLPGGKLGLNKKSMTNQILTSWKNKEDPAPGLFSLVLDPNGTSQYFILWNGTERYWTSGVWDNRTKIFSLVPEMTANYLYNFAYVDNEDESYFTYSMQDSSVVSRFVMDISGQVKQLTWVYTTEQWNLFWSQPRTQCEVYAFCGEFGICNENSTSFCSCLEGFEPHSWSNWNLRDFSDGCSRITRSNCASDWFGSLTNIRLPLYSQDIVQVRNVKECEKSCIDNCSCTAYAYDSKCQIWDTRLLNLQQYDPNVEAGDTLFIRLNASEFQNAKSYTAMIIGIVAGAVTSLILVFFLVWITMRRRATRVAKQVDGSLVPICYKDLQSATKNFSEKIGGGAFGLVYRGMLRDSTVVAVKKLQGISQGEKQFRTEVSTIGTIQHLNLVRLRGFCSEGMHKLLVYDYMPNGSLDAHLFDERKQVLSWKTRYQIALGTARGLHYLHQKCRDCIIHCDIKPENILLDAELNAKIADFGLAKLMGREFSRVLTTMRGTRGYLAPEWLSGVAVTAKADVYSYGMMLFEFVSGKRNFSRGDVNMKFFPVCAADTICKGGDVTELLDNRLEGNCDIYELRRLCMVACWCVQDDETRRPSMGQIVQILEGVLEVSMPPTYPRSLQMFTDNLDDDSIVFFTTESSSTSPSLKQAHSLSSSDSYQAKNNMGSN